MIPQGGFLFAPAAAPLILTRTVAAMHAPIDANNTIGAEPRLMPIERRQTTRRRGRPRQRRRAVEGARHGAQARDAIMRNYASTYEVATPREFHQWRRHASKIGSTEDEYQEWLAWRMAEAERVRREQPLFGGSAGQHQRSRIGKGPYDGEEEDQDQGGAYGQGAVHVAQAALEEYERGQRRNTRLPPVPKSYGSPSAAKRAAQKPRYYDPNLDDDASRKLFVFRAKSGKPEAPQDAAPDKKKKKKKEDEHHVALIEAGRPEGVLVRAANTELEEERAKLERESQARLERERREREELMYEMWKVENRQRADKEAEDAARARAEAERLRNERMRESERVFSEKMIVQKVKKEDLVKEIERLEKERASQAKRLASEAREERRLEALRIEREERELANQQAAAAARAQREARERAEAEARLTLAARQREEEERRAEEEKRLLAEAEERERRMRAERLRMQSLREEAESLAFEKKVHLDNLRAEERQIAQEREAHERFKRETAAREAAAKWLHEHESTLLKARAEAERDQGLAEAVQLARLEREEEAARRRDAVSHRIELEELEAHAADARTRRPDSPTTDRLVQRAAIARQVQSEKDTAAEVAHSVAAAADQLERQLAEGIDKEKREERERREALQRDLEASQALKRAVDSAREEELRVSRERYEKEARDARVTLEQKRRDVAIMQLTSRLVRDFAPIFERLPVLPEDPAVTSAGPHTVMPVERAAVERLLLASDGFVPTVLLYLEAFKANAARFYAMQDVSTAVARHLGETLAAKDALVKLVRSPPGTLVRPPGVLPGQKVTDHDLLQIVMDGEDLHALFLAGPSDVDGSATLGVAQRYASEGREFATFHALCMAIARDRCAHRAAVRVYLASSRSGLLPDGEVVALRAHDLDAIVERGRGLDSTMLILEALDGAFRRFGTVGALLIAITGSHGDATPAQVAEARAAGTRADSLPAKSVVEEATRAVPPVPALGWASAVDAPVLEMKQEQKAIAEGTAATPPRETGGAVSEEIKAIDKVVVEKEQEAGRVEEEKEREKYTAEQWQASSSQPSVMDGPGEATKRERRDSEPIEEPPRLAPEEQRKVDRRTVLGVLSDPNLHLFDDVEGFQVTRRSLDAMVAAAGDVDALQEILKDFDARGRSFKTMEQLLEAVCWHHTDPDHPLSQPPPTPQELEYAAHVRVEEEREREEREVAILDQRRVADAALLAANAAASAAMAAANAAAMAATMNEDAAIKSNRGVAVEDRDSIPPTPVVVRVRDSAPVAVEYQPAEVKPVEEGSKPVDVVTAGVEEPVADQEAVVPVPVDLSSPQQPQEEEEEEVRASGEDPVQAVEADALVSDVQADAAVSDTAVSDTVPPGTSAAEDPVPESGAAPSLPAMADDDDDED